MSQVLQHVALVSESAKITASELASVSAALQKQALRDLAPVWECSATVDAFPSLDEVPLGYWPIVVMDQIDDQSAAGYHTDDDGQPFAVVQYESGWPLTASHECLEMLVDPFGDRLIEGYSIHPDQQGMRVRYLVEVADPSESQTYGYTVNEVLVSDFYFPRYFDPVAEPGSRYSFTGAPKSPREVLPGGYLSWHEPVSDNWFQAQFFGAKLTFENLGKMSARQGGVRSQIDRLTNTAMLKAGLTASGKRRSDEKAKSKGKTRSSKTVADGKGARLTAAALQRADLGQPFTDARRSRAAKLRKLVTELTRNKQTVAAPPKERVD